MEEINYVMNGTKVRGPSELWPPNQTFESLFSHLNAIARSGSLLGAPECVEIYDFYQMKQMSESPIKPKYIDAA